MLNNSYVTGHDKTYESGPLCGEELDQLLDIECLEVFGAGDKFVYREWEKGQEEVPDFYSRQQERENGLQSVIPERVETQVHDQNDLKERGSGLGGVSVNGPP